MEMLQPMKKKQRNTLFLHSLMALCLLLLSACLPAPGSPNQQVSPLLPTEAPTATTNPLATATPAVPEGFYATQQADTQATMFARATASPFPTALPGAVVQGQPASAIRQREGLQLSVRLPKDTYLAGEGGQAEVEIRNAGPETVFIEGNGIDLASLALLDQQGQEPKPWPPSLAALLAGQPYLQKLAPGGALTKTLSFQVPPVEQNPPALFYLWAESRFSRQSPDQPEGADNLWMRLEAGPLALHIQRPDPVQMLHVDWQVDRSGWRLRVKDAQARVPTSPFWGEIGIVSPNGLCVGPLPTEPPGTGEWTGTWDQTMQLAGTLVIAQGWIAAPGYVTAAFSQTLPGAGDARSMLGLPANGPQRMNYSTLEAAQAGLDFPIPAMAPHLNGAALETVQVEKRIGENGETWTTVEQQVHLPGGSWIALTQMATTASYARAGWGQARYDWEARQVKIQDETGYAIQRFGWWYLDWKIGEMGFELRAPIASYSLEDLLNLVHQLSY
jgi:hypothetical protein